MLIQAPELSIVYPSPVGDLLLTRDGSSLTRLAFTDSRRELSSLAGGHIDAPLYLSNECLPDDDPFSELVQQLDEYFAGERQVFELRSLSIRFDGTPFQQRVWRELCRIPYAQTLSYGELARRIGQPNASRAVGLANGRNPISILVPCHRVIGANGKLVGYGGGLDRKRKLLEIEAAGLRIAR